MSLMFGVCAFALGVNSIIRVNSMPVVILSVLLGFGFGHLFRLDECIQKLANCLLCRGSHGDHNEVSLIVTAFTVFCCSGLGWYGSLAEAISGDASALLSKAILDGFTAVIFAATLSYAVCLLSIPQFITMIIVFGVGIGIKGTFTQACYDNLLACGGIITVAAGLRMTGIKQIPTVDMAPALVLVILITKIIL